MEKLKINGMNCGHCSLAVKKAIESVEGTFDVNVDHEKNQAEFGVKTSGIMEKVKKAVIDSGYGLIE